jgi:hypothetical protein
MVALQEELDWAVYRLFGVTSEQAREGMEGLAALPLGCRAFERFLSERGALSFESWLSQSGYEAGGFADLSAEVRRAIEARLAEIAGSKSLLLLEKPEHKRRWRATETSECFRSFARSEVADSVERAFAGKDVALAARGLVEACSSEAVQTLLAGVAGEISDIGGEVRRVLARESVPFLAAYRYTDAGAEKRALWEQTWELQRLEDAGRGGAPILVPPKYDVKDFRDANFYRLRGKLDVPKERFISYPGCESDEDGEPIYGWAGWDHLQRAAALVDLFYKRKDGEGWPAERLVPILSGLLELLPWLKQWHNEPDADGERMGEQYELVLDEELRQLGLRRERLRAWRPEPGRRGRGKAAAAVEAAEAAEAAEAEQAEQAPAAAASAERPAKRRGRPPKDKAKREAAADAPPLRLFGDDEG